MREIYLDNSATTALCREAKDAMARAADEIYGNPSSLHAVGLRAEKAVESARSSVMRAIGSRDSSSRVFFCASGTEADNLAVIGSALAKKRNAGGRIIIGASEHPAINESAAHLASLGFDVVRIPTAGGAVDTGAFMRALNDRTLLVSFMTVNNETGAIYDVASLFRAAKAFNPDIITHTDAVQAFLKIPFTPEKLYSDMITVSSHKIHGPKGTGALWVSSDVIKKKALSPVIFGGGQESGLRSGTENTLGIIGMGAACSAGIKNLRENYDKLCTLRECFVTSLPDCIKVKEPPVRAPHIINITLPDIKSETMLHYLSGRGIYVSSGSACSSHGHAGNRVLADFGVSEHEADCSLRISLCALNTEEEMREAARALREGTDSLIRTH